MFVFHHGAALLEQAFAVTNIFSPHCQVTLGPLGLPQFLDQSRRYELTGTATASHHHTRYIPLLY